MRTHFLIFAAILICVISFTETAHGAAPLTYRYEHFLFSIDPADHLEWRSPREVWTWNGMPVVPPASWRVDGDSIPAFPPGVVRSEEQGWNRSAIRTTLEQVVGSALRRDPGSVVISATSSMDI